MLGCVGADAALARKRKKLAKKSRKNFTEGWVEFADKKIAKAVALTLNNSQIGIPHVAGRCVPFDSLSFRWKKGGFLSRRFVVDKILERLQMDSFNRTNRFDLFSSRVLFWPSITLMTCSL